MDIEQIEGIIGDPSSWKIHEETGELVEVLIPGGRGERMKLRKSEAIRLGLWKESESSEETKAKTQTPNKARKQSPNK